MNNLSKEYKIKIWKRKGKPVCSKCGKPIYGNVNPKAVLTCSICLMKKADAYSMEGRFLVGEIKYGEQLKALREVNKINQREMAKKLHISLSYYRKLENNNRLILKGLRNKIKKIIENGELPSCTTRTPRKVTQARTL